jgi:two-component system, cell cycle response regulator
MSLRFRRSKDSKEGLIVDRVTGAFNRRQLDIDLANGVDQSGRSTATLMIDVDDFVQYDGKRGVSTGDKVLERVAWIVMATVRTSDIVYRHGDSTFCVLLPSTADDQATIVAERVRSNIESTPLLAESNVTVSVGVAIGSSEQLPNTVRRADEALVSGTASGGNRVVYS